MIVNCDTLSAWPVAPRTVQMIATSPPYWGLRDYGVTGQFGLERLADCLGWARGENCGACYVCRTVLWAGEAWRVLKDDGVMFLNLGDSYIGGKGASGSQGKEYQQMRCESGVSFSSPEAHVGGKKKTRPSDDLGVMRQMGLKPKDLTMIPARAALALQAAGWYLRQDIIWNKPNVMPESVRDRFTKSHEYIFLLTKRPRYYWDAEAVKEPVSEVSLKRAEYRWNCDRESTKSADGIHTDKMGSRFVNPTGRNPRSVWTIATASYKGAHFATWPTALVEKMVLAGSSSMGECPTCGESWRRVTERKTSTNGRKPHYTQASGRMDGGGERGGGFVDAETKTLGWSQSCACPPAPPIPNIVLDPFSGTGTTGKVAHQHQRRYIGLEINPAYIALSAARMEVQVQAF